MFNNLFYFRVASRQIHLSIDTDPSNSPWDVFESFFTNKCKRIIVRTVQLINYIPKEFYMMWSQLVSAHGARPWK